MTPAGYCAACLSPCDPDDRLCEHCSHERREAETCATCLHLHSACVCGLTCSDCGTVVDSESEIHPDPDPERAARGWQYCEHCYAVGHIPRLGRHGLLVLLEELLVAEALETSDPAQEEHLLTLACDAMDRQEWASSYAPIRRAS